MLTIVNYNKDEYNFPALVVLGCFDAIHIGHAELLKKAKLQAKINGLDLGVMMFNSGKGGKQLYSFEERCAFLEKYNVKFVLNIDYTDEFKKTTAAQFLETVEKFINVKGYMSGKDFRFGAGAKGKSSTLKNYADDEDNGVWYASIKDVVSQGEKVSTTLIKKCLEEGQAVRAAELLGRNFSVSGTVCDGSERGSKLGIPTANMIYPEYKSPVKQGVYGVEVTFGGETYKGVANFGARPTFGEDNPVLETYIIDYDGNLYGKEITVSFINYIRGIRKFDDAQALCDQIKADIGHIGDPDAICEEPAETPAELIAEPVAETVVEPAAEPVAETVVEPAAEPVAETAAEPVAEPADEEVTESEITAEEVIASEAASVEEPASEPVEEAAEETAAEVTQEVIEEPAEEVTAEPVEEITEEPAAAEVMEEVTAVPEPETTAEEKTEEPIEEPAEEAAEAAEVIEESEQQITVEEVTENEVAPLEETTAEPAEESAGEIAEEQTEAPAPEATEEASEETTEEVTETAEEKEVSEETVEETAEPEITVEEVTEAEVSPEEAAEKELTPEELAELEFEREFAILLAEEEREKAEKEAAEKAAKENNTEENND